MVAEAGSGVVRAVAIGVDGAGYWDRLKGILPTGAAVMVTAGGKVGEVFAVFARGRGMAHF